MLDNKRQSMYFRVISRIDGFEVGKCLNEYYVRHPRGLIDWVSHEVDQELLALVDEIPRDVVGRIREVLVTDVSLSKFADPSIGNTIDPYSPFAQQHHRS